MQDIITYRVVVRGAVGEEELNRVSPFHVRLVSTSDLATTVTVHADQSGLIGLLRHLHGQGYVLLSFTRREEEDVHVTGSTGSHGGVGDEVRSL